MLFWVNIVTLQFFLARVGLVMICYHIIDISYLCHIILHVHTSVIYTSVHTHSTDLSFHNLMIIPKRTILVTGLLKN